MIRFPYRQLCAHLKILSNMLLSLFLLFLTSIGNMQECQEKARDLMRPGMENDANQISKVEQKLISCMSKQVDDHIKMLRTMKDRCVVTCILRAYAFMCSLIHKFPLIINLLSTHHRQPPKIVHFPPPLHFTTELL